MQTNTWQQFIVPLSALGVANRTNFTGFVIQDRVGAAQPTFYVDDIQLLATPAPALSHLSVNTTQAVRSMDARWFAVNTAIWDSNFDTPATISLLQVRSRAQAVAKYAHLSGGEQRPPAATRVR